MSVSRKTVMRSLAERGIPEVWANQSESAALSRMSVENFRGWLQTDDARGFPPADPANGCRLVNHIMDFWEKRSQSVALLRGNEEELENWHEQGKRKDAA